MATAYLKLNREEEAVTGYLRAIKTDKYYIQAYEPLGNLLLKQGKKKDALTIFKSLITIDPNYPEKEKIEYIIKQIESST
jgi:tetratricopeptide (TPR) repeat protein